MPTFTPGFNPPTVLTLVIATIAAAGLVVGAFITSRYSLLSKILESKDKDQELSDRRAQKTVERFDSLEAKMHSIEAELQASRNETLTARQEILAVKQENSALREENAQLKLTMQARDLDYKEQMQSRDAEIEKVKADNKRLSGECESLRRRIQKIDASQDVIG